MVLSLIICFILDGDFAIWNGIDLHWDVVDGELVRFGYLWRGCAYHKEWPFHRFALQWRMTLHPKWEVRAVWGQSHKGINQLLRAISFTTRLKPRWGHSWWIGTSCQRKMRTDMSCHSKISRRQRYVFGLSGNALLRRKIGDDCLSSICLTISSPLDLEAFKQDSKGSLSVKEHACD